MMGALIPPAGHYNQALKSDYHLVLAQIEDPAYKNLYRNLPASHYMILDNGAAEGDAVSNEVLINRAMYYGADEIVVPDVMRDCGATVKAASKFFHEVGKDVLRGTKYMVVVQGRRWSEVFTCIDAFMENDRIDTLGIPRHMLDTLDDRHARLKLCDYISKVNAPNKDVHLLGTNAVWSSEIQKVAQEHPWVRGVDTSMPFNYTLNDKELSTWQWPVIRPYGYFVHIKHMNTDLLNRNISTYLGWASGTEGTGS